MALAHVRAGDREKALEIVHEAERHPRQDFAALVLSVVHGLLGEEDEAITILERLFEERLPALVYLNGWTYAPLRGSPRFQNLTGRIGLPQRQKQVTPDDRKALIDAFTRSGQDGLVDDFQSNPR
jgi:hypothetical protein